MSELHPRARSLIDAAKQGEGSLSPDVKARVHRSVLRRAFALGAVVASAGTTSVVSKAAALLAALPASLTVPAMVTAAAGAALVVLEARSTTPMSLPPPAAPMHAATAAPGPLPRAVIDETPVVVSSAVSATPAPTEGPMATNGVPAPNAAPKRVPRVAAASIAPRREPSPPPAVTALPDARSALAPHLVEDIALLQRARQALQAGDPTTALSLLDRPDSGLDAGPLAEEAQLARISALCQLGRTTEAQAATERLRSAWPGSPAATRLRGGCAVLAPPRKPSED
jgi:hypothetical protein